MGLLSRLLGRPAPLPTVRRFDAAGGGRRWEGVPNFGRVSAETLAAAGPIRSRARYAVANNPWSASGVAALVTGLVGSGISAAPSHPDLSTRATIEGAFAAWLKAADVEGRTDLYGLQAQVARALVVDGESFVQMVTLPEGLRLRLLPAEMVDESYTADLQNGAYAVAGIEFDPMGRRVGYHVLKARPTDVFSYSADRVRIPASDMLHIMQPMGAGQVRGISWLAPVLLRLSELDQLEDALGVGVKTAAMFAGFLVDQNGAGEPFDGKAQDGILSQGLEPGVLQRLPHGFDIKFSAPQQAQQTAEFVAHSIRAVAAGLGVPAYLVSGNLSEANFSSLRAGMAAFRQRLQQIQHGVLIPQLCDPVFKRAVTLAMLQGDIAFGGDPAAYTAADHYPSPQPYVDPEKDIAATVAAIEAGLLSRRQAVAAGTGRAIEDLDAEIAADRAREVEMKLNLGGPANGPANA